MALSTTSSSRICEGHWVTRLAIYYGVDTSGMVTISIRELSTTALEKMQVLYREAGQPWRIPEDGIVEPI